MYNSTRENTNIGDIISSFKGISKIGMVAKFTPKGISCYYIHTYVNSDSTFFTDYWVHVDEAKLPKHLQEDIKQFRKDRGI